MATAEKVKSWVHKNKREAHFFEEALRKVLQLWCWIKYITGENVGGLSPAEVHVLLHMKCFGKTIVS